MAFPTVEYSERERAAGVPEQATIDEAVRLFEVFGSVRLVGAYEPAFMQRLAEEYRRRYRGRLVETSKQDKRPLFTPRISGVFAEPTYHSNPLIVPFLDRVLGKDWVLGACGSVVSFPGAPDQFVHRDSESLYDDFSIDVRLPTYALTMLVPLVDADRETGSTRVWPGSHRVPSFDEAREMPSESPDVAVGSVLVTDSKTLHGGSPNVSDRVRPLVYNAYHRHWYRDDGGYAHRPAVGVGPLGHLFMPEEQRPLFRIARESSTVDRVAWSWKRMKARARQVKALRFLKDTLTGRRGA